MNLELAVSWEVDEMKQNSSVTSDVRCLGIDRVQSGSRTLEESMTADALYRWTMYLAMACTAMLLAL